MRLLVSLCSRTDKAPESLVVVDHEKVLIEPVSVPDPGYGAFGLWLASSTIYVVMDRGRPLPAEPERCAQSLRKLWDSACVRS